MVKIKVLKTLGVIESEILTDSNLKVIQSLNPNVLRLEDGFSVAHNGEDYNFNAVGAMFLDGETIANFNEGLTQEEITEELTVVGFKLNAIEEQVKTYLKEINKDIVNVNIEFL